jgi:hypothetical protein
VQGRPYPAFFLGLPSFFGGSASAAGYSSGSGTGYVTANPGSVPSARIARTDTSRPFHQATYSGYSGSGRTMIHRMICCRERQEIFGQAPRTQPWCRMSLAKSGLAGSGVTGLWPA